MAARNAPAPIAPSEPSHGECVPHVTAAAANAPTIMIPSSAMLITPARSLSAPPSAANTSGVDTRSVEARSWTTNSSATGRLPSLESLEPGPKPFGRDRQDHQRLEDEGEIAGHVLGLHVQV